MNPERAYARLQRLMAARDAAAPWAVADRDSPGFRAFAAAEGKVERFLARHDAALARLREPAVPLSREEFAARLAAMDAELDWLAARAGAAGNTGPAQEAYSATWTDRMSFAANRDPDAGADAEPEAGLAWTGGVHRTGGQGGHLLRAVPGRQALPVGRHRGGRVRLAGFDPGVFACGTSPCPAVRAGRDRAGAGPGPVRGGPPRPAG